MNFWEYKEDHSRGYYLPVSNNAARKEGAHLVTGLFFLVSSLFKLAWSLVTAVGHLLYMIYRFVRKSMRN